MTSPSREEIDARLETIEARMDRRVASLASKIDAKFAELRSDLHKTALETSRWMIATVISLFLGFAGLFFVMFNTVRVVQIAAPAPAQPSAAYEQRGQLSPPMPAPSAKN